MKTSLIAGTLLLLLPLFLLDCEAKKEPEIIDYLGQKPPGTTAQLFAPGLISTPAMEHSAPAFSPDGTRVLWTVLDSNYHAFLLEMTYKNGVWSKPAPPSFADPSADDYYPCFSVEGKTLFFSSRRKMPAGYRQGGDIRIWEVLRTSTGWSTAVPFDTSISKGQDYGHSITKNGNLYFASALGGGTNWNIQQSIQQNGRYTKPRLLPFSINSVDYEEGPYIAPDESFLIFESIRPEGIEGSLDLYISFKNKAGRWSLPLNMGPKINSGSSERFASLSPDGKYLFFGSSRNQSPERPGFDIFWIDASVIDDLKKSQAAKTKIEPGLGETIIGALFRNDVETAAPALKKWLALYPQNLDATVLYSSTLRKQQQYTNAAQLLDKVADRWKNNTNILMERALVQFGLNKVEEANKILKPLLVEGDQLRERYLYLSVALLDMGTLQPSEVFFEKAMAIHASSYPYFNRACTLARMGEKDRAFAALNQAVNYGSLVLKTDYQNVADLKPLESDARWEQLLARLK